jgi:hypothetical protein
VKIEKRPLLPHLLRLGDIEDCRHFRDCGEWLLLVTLTQSSAAKSAMARFNGRRWRGVRLSAHWWRPLNDDDWLSI